MAIQASCVLAIAICSQYYFVLTNQDDFAKKEIEMILVYKMKKKNLFSHSISSIVERRSHFQGK